MEIKGVFMKKKFKVILVWQNGDLTELPLITEEQVETVQEDFFKKDYLKILSKCSRDAANLYCKLLNLGFVREILVYDENE